MCTRKRGKKQPWGHPYVNYSQKEGGGGLRKDKKIITWRMYSTMLRRRAAEETPIHEITRQNKGGEIKMKEIVWRMDSTMPRRGAAEETQMCEVHPSRKGGKPRKRRKDSTIPRRGAVEETCL